MNRVLYILCALIIPGVSVAEQATCSNVTITKILTGPRHGSMIQTSKSTCGNNGYICLDPEGEFMSQVLSDRLFSFALSAYMAGKSVDIVYELGNKPVACNGTYPTVDDMRSSVI